jgi:predicted glycogen debranching enzyme
MPIAFDADVTQSFEEGTSREWLEANGLGGWAMGTISGCLTRRYHGLLVAATRPPGGRMVLLSKLAETLVAGDRRIELDTNRYPGAVHPRGFTHLARFALEPFPTFEFEVSGLRLRKTVAAVHGENTTVVLYEVVEADGEILLELRPLIAFRDAHALQRENGAIRFADASFREGVFRARPYERVPELVLQARGASFHADPDWYRRFEYARESERGLEAHEDLFTHGVFRRTLAKGERFGVIASTADVANRDPVALLDAERARRAALVEAASAPDDDTRALVSAADAFIVRRGEDLRTIIAGYPWFTDWGRDTMIALPGLCLATGRLDAAARILRAHVRWVDRGMLPNRFPEEGAPPEYNSVDAALWLFVAVRKYLDAGGDDAFVLAELVPVLREIVDWHVRGTRHGIVVDDDGLLRAGAPGLQLTWMDAKVGDTVITPRHGKPVEIQALWYNALVILADLEGRAGHADASAGLAARAQQVKERFVALFWNDETSALFDVVDGERKDASIRPNQIFALSLPHPLLPKDKARAVLAVVESKLATPVGLRTLAPDDPAYRGRYEGPPEARDAAYHQGTVWAWLLGPYADALVRTGGAVGKAKARRALAGIVPHLREAGLGTISEIFDGDAPHRPRGCPAQAWSVGETLRALVLTVPAPRKRPYKVVTVATKPSPSGPRRRAAGV